MASLVESPGAASGGAGRCSCRQPFLAPCGLRKGALVCWRGSVLVKGGKQRRLLLRPPLKLSASFVLLLIGLALLSHARHARGDPSSDDGTEPEADAEAEKGASDAAEDDADRGEDPLVEYRTGRARGGERCRWETPFMRPLRVDPLAGGLPGKCKHLAPGFDPEVVAARDVAPRITSMEQLRDLAEGRGTPGQKVLLVAPRFGLGNTLRNWVSAFFWGLFSGRRIVLLHGGRYHGVFTSLCDAFGCAFDHIYPSLDSPEGRNKEANKMLEEVEHTMQPRRVSQRVARDALWWDDPLVFSFSYAFWDHWWLNNRSLSACGCRAIAGCKYGGGVRAKALHALISGGPSEALGETIEAVLRRHQPPPSRILLPISPQLGGAEGALRARELLPAGCGVAMQFDVGFHIRTRTSVLENPNRPFGGCKTPEDCEEKRLEELRKIRSRFLSSSAWQCIGLFLGVVAGLHGPERVRPLSIFLATDNQALRPEFVHRLSRYGAVYYNGADVAHVGVSAAKDKGRLPTMAEFYLLGKSHIIVEVDSYLSTFSYFSGLMGNGTIITLPYIVKKMERCTRLRPVQKGIWRRSDPRRSSNDMFSIR